MTCLALEVLALQGKCMKIVAAGTELTWKIQNCKFMPAQAASCVNLRSTHVYLSHSAASATLCTVPSTISALRLSGMVRTYWLSMGSCWLKSDR